MAMSEIIVLALLFTAVFTFVWVLVPVLMQMGLQRTEGRYVGKAASPYDPMRRFTTPERLLQVCWAVALLGGGVTISVLVAFGFLNVYILLGAGSLSGAVLYHLPIFWLRKRIKKRQLLFGSRLLDLTIGLANGLRAGSALPQSLAYIGRDLGGPVGEELNLLLHEHRLGIELSEGFNRLCLRMPNEDLELLATAIRLTLHAGGSLADVLDKITKTIRDRTEFQERLRTMTSQGRFEAIAMGAAPMCAFGILYLIDPSLMRPLLTTKVGWCAIGVVLALETVGFLVINKIVTIEA